MQLTPLLILFVLLTSASSVIAQTKWITNASGIKVRSEPSTSSEEITRVSIGSIVSQIGDESRPDRIGNIENSWRKVTTANGKIGWIFGKFLFPFDSGKRGEIYLKIASSKIKDTEAKFADYADLTSFLTKVIPELSERKFLAELELLRLKAMQAAFYDLPKTPEGERFLNSQKAYILRDYAGGDWLVKTEIFWDLHKKYDDLPIADRIAWEAAEHPLGGECEGDETCELSRISQTYVRYLKLHPKGRYANDALNQLTQTFKNIDSGAYYSGGISELTSPETAREIRKHVIANIASFRAALSAISNPKKQKILLSLSKFEKRYK